MNKVLFLPYAGEFGWFITVHIRRVHLCKTDHKVVLCKSGQEIFFPSATRFIHDFQLPILDKQKKGTGGWLGGNHMNELCEFIDESYPELRDYKKIQPFMKWHCYNDFDRAYTFFD